MRWWDTATGQELRALQAHPVAINAMVGSPDGRLLASAGQDRRLNIIDTATGRLLRVARYHADAVLCVAFSPDARLVATGGKDRLLCVMDTTNGNAEFRPPVLKDEVTAVAFSPDGKILAAAGADRVIRLWDYAARKETFQLSGHQDRIRSLVFAPHGKTLLSCSADRSIRVWDAASGRQLRLAIRHRGPVTSLAVSSDGRLIASASDDGTVIVSNVAGLQDWKPEPIDLSAKQLDQLWADLVQDDARSVQAMWTLVAGGKHAVTFLQEHLKDTRAPVVPEHLAKLIKDLDDDAFGVREKASQELERLGKAVEDALHRELKQTSSAEVRRRIDQLLEKLGPRPARSPEQLRIARAVDVLEQIGTPEARQVLEQLARGEPRVELTQLAKEALERLARRPATP